MTPWLRWARSDRGAFTGFVVAFAVAVITCAVIGRYQWFIRDDWAFTITRGQIRDGEGLWSTLMYPQDGHWMASSVALWEIVKGLFGLDSYWPFLLLAMGSHLLVTVLLRMLLVRWGVSAWIATLLASVFALFGAGWENIVFAVQITFNLSLAAMLAHLLFADHDGQIGRRDIAGLACGVIGLTSSGLGVFGVFAVGTVLAMRGRWRAAITATAPLAALWLWWFWRWGRLDAGATEVGKPTQVPRFVGFALRDTLGGIIGSSTLIGLFAVGLLWSAWLLAQQAPPRGAIALAAAGIVTITAIAVQRVGFGVQAGSNPRYVYTLAVFLIPLIGLAIDHWGTAVHRTLVPVTGLLLVSSAIINASMLHAQSFEWSRVSSNERRIAELVAGSPLTAGADPQRPILPWSLEITVGLVPTLVAEGTITPRPTLTAEDDQLVRSALGLP
jgi:hypothetical protein